MVAVGPGDAAVKGRELALGQIAGYLEVVEGVVAVDVPEEVDQVEMRQQVPRERRAVGEDTAEKQDKQGIVQRRRTEYPPPPLLFATMC